MTNSKTMIKPAEAYVLSGWNRATFLKLESKGLIDVEVSPFGHRKYCKEEILALKERLRLEQLNKKIIK